MINKELKKIFCLLEKFYYLCGKFNKEKKEMGLTEKDLDNNSLIGEFIPYQEAFELKKLGFNEPCLTYFFDTLVDIVLYPQTQVGSGFSLKGFKNSHKKFQSKDCTAPTYSASFRWFREKGYDVKIQKESKGVYFGFYWNGAVWFIIGSGTHREAELMCLKKLINIANESL